MKPGRDRTGTSSNPKLVTVERWPRRSRQRMNYVIVGLNDEVWPIGSAQAAFAYVESQSVEEDTLNVPQHDARAGLT